MGAPFNTYQVPYHQQQNLSYSQTQEYHNNSFTKQNSKTQQQDATAIIEQLRQLLLPQKSSTHQVKKVKAVMLQIGTTWDLKAAAELPITQEDQSE